MKHRSARPALPRRGAGKHRPPVYTVERIAAALALSTGRAR